MENGKKIKKEMLKVLLLAIILAFVAYLGMIIGASLSIKTLLIVMIVDYLIGTSLALTGKSKHGTKLSSTVGYQGLIKKLIILLLVGVTAMIEAYLISIGVQFDHIKEVAIVAFIINEIISIIENSKMAGLEVPAIITKLVDTLKQMGVKHN